MRVIDMHCQDPWFTHLKEGRKPVEGRKGTEKWRTLKVGDCLKVTNGQDSFLATIEKIEAFPTIGDYLEKVSLEKALPGIETIEEGERIYLQWSTENEVKTHGFLAIWIKTFSS